MPAPWQAGARAVIHGRLHGQQTVNVLNFASNVPWNVDTITVTLNALGTAIVECVMQTLLPAVTNEWQFLYVSVKGIHGQVTDEAIVPAQGNAIGALGPCSHSFAASLMNIGTNGGGKSGRGRNFLPPPGEAQVAASVIDAPTLVLLAAFGLCLNEKFMGANATTDWRLGVYSRKNAGGLLGNFDNGFREATSLVFNPQVSIMGSRRLGRGN